MATTEVKIAPENMQAASRPSERIPEPGVVVIFGASGDLTKRKLLPALFHLEQQGLLPKEFAIVGVARRDLKSTFAADMKDGILKFGGGKDGDHTIDEFIEKVDYHAMNFDDDRGYTDLKALLEQIDKEHGTRGNRVFYLAVAPEYFSDIIDHLGKHGMAHPEKGHARVIIEKPFGHDLESAKELNNEVNKVFDEEQIFRIDHYLGKETVQNILVFRFANGILSRSGTATISITCRSRQQRALGLKAVGHSMRKQGRCAMWFRTT